MERNNREEYTEFLTDVIFASTGISIFLFDNKLEILKFHSKWANHMKNFFLLNCPYDLQKLIDADDDAPLSYSDALHLNWIIIPLTGQEQFIVMGPTFETDLTSASFHRLMNFKAMPVSSQINFLKMLKDIPVIARSQFMHYGTMLYYGIYDKLIPIKMEAESPATAPVDINQYSSIRNIPPSHGSRLIEQRMLENVRNGSIDAMQNIYRIDISAPIVGELSPGDPVRQAKNLIIIQTALITRAAVEGGMDAEKAYTLSDAYIQLIELCDNVNEVYGFSHKIYETFVKEVHEIKQKNHSEIVKFICAYIDKHIFEVIDLKDISSSLGYDTYYITNLFHKDTGMTIKRYILEKKIELAKDILKTTLREISEISEILGFYSPSYFATQFKKCVGVTPVSYRKNHTELEH